MTVRHDAVEVIVAKRDGGELTDSQIDWVVDAYTRGAVADEQMSALAMAILLNGMSRQEISRWTAAMIASGERMDFSSLSRPTADKHSTGGVGDKITLPLAPLVAACGVAVPQLSGRGLGHTGGTLDKLESIPGWRADLGNEEMMHQLEDVGAVICAAGAGLAPADKKLYALRDVTGTVEAIPLIASSIMSKKIAEGTGALVLDVKVGSGAFMKDSARARELAERTWNAHQANEDRARLLDVQLAVNRRLTEQFVTDFGAGARNDILWKHGWWEQPAAGPDKGPWNYHPQAFTNVRTGGAEMAVQSTSACRSAMRWSAGDISRRSPSASSPTRRAGTGPRRWISDRSSRVRPMGPSGDGRWKRHHVPSHPGPGIPRGQHQRQSK